MQNQSNIIIEKTVLQTHTGFGYKFSLPSDYVIYFEKEQNIESNLYIRKNFELLKSQFSFFGLNFIYLPFMKQYVKDIDKVFDYYFPSLDYYQIPGKMLENYKEKLLKHETRKALNDFEEILSQEVFKPNPYDYRKTLELINYQGSFNSGLLFFGIDKYGTGETVVGETDFFNNHKDYSLFFADVISYLKQLRENEEELDYMLFAPKNIEEYSEQLDEEAKEIITTIENRLSELKDSGQLLFVIPILKELLNKQSESLKLDDISRLEINSKNKILLPFFKKEVELSHLTKSIYFLFLKHPEGINLKNLESYKKELLTIYTSVSNQLDHDKMIKSIEDVVNLETKAIYTHLSRIKSAFFKIMDASHANHYIISGNGEEDRKVLFNTKAIDWYVYDPIEDYEL